MSFWVTLVAMSRLTEPVRSFLYMLAALGLSLGVTWDRHSLWTFLVPAAVAFIIMAITWVGYFCIFLVYFTIYLITKLYYITKVLFEKMAQIAIQYFPTFPYVCATE